MIFITFLLLLASLPAWATDYYVSPTGSGTACTQSTPCSWQTGRQNTMSGDRLRFLDGIYDGVNTSGIETIRDGSSSSNRITWESVNPRGAKLRYLGPSDTGAADLLIIRHRNYIIRGFELICRAANGARAWNCMQVNGDQHPNDQEVQNVLIENVYLHDTGHSLFSCYLGTNIELRNSSFDNSGLDPALKAQNECFGEANYFSSSGKQEPKICTINHHHNMFGRYSGNAVDMKNQTRNVKVHDNIFLDKKTCGSNDLGVGDGDLITQGGAGTSTSAAGNEFRDNITYRTIPGNGHLKNSDGHRADFFGNVLWSWPSISGASSAKNFNYVGWSPSASISSNNIHCGSSDGASSGPDQDQGGTPNVINRPFSECTTRINTILGVPGIASCEIGSVNNTTLVVNFQANKNGPISSVGTAGQLAVTYNAAAQTENSVTLTSGTQARIIMASPPASGQTIQVTPAVGSIKNSAFIGGMNCDMPLNTIETDPGGTNVVPGKIVDGRGVCGSNITATPVTCTNNVGGSPPPTETLDQAVYRFYASHQAEGDAPLIAENSSISSSLGDTFRLRIGVRGGGNDAPSRAYELASRICNPTCGNWSKVTADFSGSGITYQDDQVQSHGTATTNQISLGGKTFIAGAFIETPVDTPAVAIASTQQVEWEFSLVIPRDNNPLVAGNTLELRIQHGDGTVLSAYTLPSITIGAASSGISGAFSGGIIQ